MIAPQGRVRNGVTVPVHRNAGLRKICRYPRRAWAKCPHPWHFNFCWKGTPYRFSLSRYAGKEIVSKTDAETLADDRTTPLVHDDSDIVRRKKETQPHRRLEPGEEEKLLAAADPHLRAVIVAALETCCRQGELLSLRWTDVSLARGEIVLRPEHTKDREKRVIPISSRLRDALEARRNDPDASPHGVCVRRRDRPTDRKRQTSMANGCPEGSRSPAGLDLEEEERTERQGEHAAEPGIRSRVSRDRSALP